MLSQVAVQPIVKTAKSADEKSPPAYRVARNRLLLLEEGVCRDYAFFCTQQVRYRPAKFRHRFP